MSDNSDNEIVPSFRPAEYVWMKKRISIDTASIDEEVIELPNLVQQVGEYASIVLGIQEAADNDLKVTTALASDQLRKALNHRGKSRSETQILSEVPMNPEVIEKQETLSRAKLDARLWNTVMEALRRKDSGIRTVVDLLNSGFLTRDAIFQKRRKEIRNVTSACQKKEV